MPRIKRSPNALKKRRKVLHEAQGYYGLKKSSLPEGQRAATEVLHIRLPRPQGSQG